MHSSLSIADIYPLIKEKLDAGGSVMLPASGKSMLPLFRQNRDIVVITSAALKKPQKNDLALYQSNNGQFLLHRIVGFEKNGDLIFCGDNQLHKEHHVSPQQIVGYVERFIRYNRVYQLASKKYQIYCFMLPALRFLWPILYYCLHSKYTKVILFPLREIKHRFCIKSKKFQRSSS